MVPQNAVPTLAKAPRPGKKYFDLEEAERALPYVSRVVHDLMDCYQRVVSIRRRIEHIHSRESQEQLEAQYEAAMDELGDLVDELHQVGVELKDFEKGLVDFPAVYEEREIYLCWQHGETEIHAWHETDAGLTGRQDVEVLRSDSKSIV